MSKNQKTPVVLIVMDGIGLRKARAGNALTQARAETLKSLMKDYPTLGLGASGHYVGIPDGDMGNSEVGHNAMGTGQIVLQGPAKVQAMFDSGKVFQTQAWKDAVASIKSHDSTLHLIGIFSDGNVHSNIYHLFAMMKQAQKEGVEHIRVHPAFDGRDVPPHSAEIYLEMYKKFVQSLGNPDYRIADGGGRMLIWADRYENDWDMIKRGWQIAVQGEGRKFQDPTEAVLTFRKEKNPSSDQFIPPFVIAENDQPIGTIKPHDSVVLFNFRADRAIETAVALTYHDFPHFPRQYADGTSFNPDDIYFAGMAEYNATTHVPAHTLAPPIEFPRTLADLLTERKIPQYAVSETVKYGHITYYFDGNRYLPQDNLHTYVEIPSDQDTSSFNTRPWMKAAEITDSLVEAIKSQKYQFLRVNFPNGDMVGHFGELEPAIVAVEAVDLQLRRILDAVDATQGVAIITADHGNVEELADPTSGQPKTSHTTNPVPCIFYDKTPDRKKYSVKRQAKSFGLANLASTIALLLDQTPDKSWLPALIRKK